MLIIREKKVRGNDYCGLRPNSIGFMFMIVSVFWSLVLTSRDILAIIQYNGDFDCVVVGRI